MYFSISSYICINPKFFSHFRSFKIVYNLFIRILRITNAKAEEKSGQEIEQVERTRDEAEAKAIDPVDSQTSMADMKAALEADDIAKSETEYPIESKAKGQLISKYPFRPK